MEGKLPIKKVLALCFIQLCDFINAACIYPYIIFMVKSFHVTDDDKRLGYYAGLLASSYYFAQLLSSMIWGVLSDKIGRRPCLIIGLASSALTMLVFGFSKTLVWAIVVRFFSGLLNGNVGVTKTMLGEMSNSETQARAFSFFGFTVAVSGIVGPLIGGTLSNPSEKYPNLFGGVHMFEEYPYSLPNIVACALSLLGLVTALFILPETKTWKRNENPNYIKKLISKFMPSKQPDFIKLQEMSLSSDTFSNDEDQITTQSENEEISPDLSTIVEKKVSKWSLMKDRGVLFACLIYGILGLMFVFYEEVLPYWCFLKVEDGGMAFSSTDVGLVNSSGCVLGMLFQMFIYPRIANKVGLLKAFAIGAVFTIPGLIFLPQSPRIALALTSNAVMNKNPVAWTALIIAILFIQVGGELLFISIIIAVSNSAIPEHMGTVNGIAQTLVALTRTVAPIAGSSMLSWSLTSGLKFPFDQNFPFLVLVLIAVVLLLLAAVAPATLNIQKKEALRKEKEAQMLLLEEKT